MFCSLLFDYFDYIWNVFSVFFPEQSMEIVEHRGIVEKIDGKHMQVRILQESACSECHANSLCSSAGKVEKIIDINSFTGNFEHGQAVIVTGHSSTGLKAVFLAYLLPLILMVTGMVVSLEWLFPGKEGLAALISLAIPLVYYLLLYPFKNILKRSFSFNVKHVSEDLN